MIRLQHRAAKYIFQVWSLTQHFQRVLSSQIKSFGESLGLNCRVWVISLLSKMKIAYACYKDSFCQRKSLRTKTDPDNLFQSSFSKYLSENGKIVTKRLELPVTLPNILLPFYAIAHINGLVRTKADSNIFCFTGPEIIFSLISLKSHKRSILTNTQRKEITHANFWQF